MRYLSFLLILLIFTKANSEILFEETPGIDEAIKDEYQHLSPLQGLVGIESRLLPNLRFHGNYGTEDEAQTRGVFIPKVHHIDKIPGDKGANDYPLDQVAALIQWLFPSQSGVNFGANQVDSDFLDNFTPGKKKKAGLSGIGAILNVIRDFKPINDDDEQDAYIFDLAKTLDRALYASTYSAYDQSAPAFVDKKLSEAEAALTKATHTLSASPSTSSQKVFKKAQKLHKKAVTKKKKAAKIHTKAKTALDKRYGLTTGVRDAKFEPVYILAGLIVTALHEAYASKLYPNTIVETALLGFAWKKAKEKKHIKNLLLAMPNAINDIDDIGWNQLFTKNHYFALKDKILFDPSQSLDQLINDQELGIQVALGYKFYEAKVPVSVGYTTALYKSIKFPDCGETALRQFMNFVLFNPENQAFSIGRLKTIAAKYNLVIDPNLIKFYSDYSQNASVRGEKARNAWVDVTANLNTANRKQVIYKKPTNLPVCEIKSSLKNMLTVITYLLGDPEMFKIDATGLSDNKKSEQKLNRLVQLFENDKLKLDWYDQSTSEQTVSRDTGINLAFKNTLTDEDVFTWEFQDRHVELTFLTKDDDNWTLKFGQKALRAQKLKDMPSHMQLFVSDSMRARTLEMSTNLDDQNFNAYLLGRSLEETGIKLDSLKKIFHRKGSYLYDMAHNIIRTLPQNNRQTDEVMVDALVYANTQYLLPQLKIIANKRKNELNDVSKLRDNWFYAAENKFGNALIYLTDKFKTKNLLNTANDLGYTAMHWASTTGNLEMAKTLKKIAGNKTYDLIKATNFDGINSIHLAVLNEKSLMLNWLLDIAGDKKDDLIKNLSTVGTNALHMAVLQNKPTMIDFLLDDARDQWKELFFKSERNFGNPPLHIATSKNYQDVINLLLQRSGHILFDVIQARSTNGSTAYQVATPISRLYIDKHPAYLLFKGYKHIANKNCNPTILLSLVTSSSTFKDEEIRYFYPIILGQRCATGPTQLAVINRLVLDIETSQTHMNILSLLRDKTVKLTPNSMLIFLNAMKKVSIREYTQALAYIEERPELPNVALNNAGFLDL